MHLIPLKGLAIDKHDLACRDAQNVHALLVRRQTVLISRDPLVSNRVEVPDLLVLPEALRIRKPRRMFNDVVIELVRHLERDVGGGRSLNELSLCGQTTVSIRGRERANRKAKEGTNPHKVAKSLGAAPAIDEVVHDARHLDAHARMPTLAFHDGDDAKPDGQATLHELLDLLDEDLNVLDSTKIK